MGIQYDAFIRTTDAKHEGVVRAILDRVWEKGDIYKAKYEGADHQALCFLCFLMKTSSSGVCRTTTDSMFPALSSQVCIDHLALQSAVSQDWQPICIPKLLVLMRRATRQRVLRGSHGHEPGRADVHVWQALRTATGHADGHPLVSLTLRDIYTLHAGWYCVGCEAYKDDSEMEGDHVCPTHKARCVERSEENYFFALSKYQAQIQARMHRLLSAALFEGEPNIAIDVHWP